MEIGKESNHELVVFGGDTELKCRYTLPGDPTSDVYILPVSGGADSTALAILMHRLNPNVSFKLMFSDTGAEDPEIYQCLDRLEVYLGRKIERIMPPKNMWALLDKFGGYLPSATERWCTRLVKAEPFKIWLKQFDSQTKWVFVGIRADEQKRVAFTLDGVSTEMPFIDMGWRRQDVFRLLQESIGIPRFYSRRSRSGCSFCPFQRRQELIGLYQESPTEFARAASYEKLCERDRERHPPAPSLVEETGIALNWMALPIPTDVQVLDGRIGCRKETLFGTIGVFAAAEFYFDEMPGLPAFVWKQRFLSFSTSLSGIKRQVNTRYEHLLSTAEAHDIDEWSVRNQVRFAIYYIEADASSFDPEGPSVGSFTWSSGESYAQIAHVTDWIKRVLHAASLKQEGLKCRDESKAATWCYEQGMIATLALSKVQEPIGDLIGMQWYKAKEPDIEDQLDERFVTCAMCSI